MVADIGRVLIDGTNHTLASRVEAAVASTPELADLSGDLEASKALYITTVWDSLEVAHDQLGDDLMPDATYQSYAEAAVTLARGIALSPAPQLRDNRDLHAYQFQALADYYTQAA